MGRFASDSGDVHGHAYNQGALSWHLEHGPLAMKFGTELTFEDCMSHTFFC